MNTNICEQIFAWFRNFAIIMNDMRPNRHKFLLLSLAKRHNIAMEEGNTGYLHSTRRPNPFGASKPYSCSKKVILGKTMKTSMSKQKISKTMKKNVMKK